MQLKKHVRRCELHGDKRGHHLDQMAQSDEKIANDIDERENQERIVLRSCCLQRRPQLPCSATFCRRRLHELMLSLVNRAQNRDIFKFPRRLPDMIQVVSMENGGVICRDQVELSMRFFYLVLTVMVETVFNWFR